MAIGSIKAQAFRLKNSGAFGKAGRKHRAAKFQGKHHVMKAFGREKYTSRMENIGINSNIICVISPNYEAPNHSAQAQRLTQRTIKELLLDTDYLGSRPQFGGVVMLLYLLGVFYSI